MRHIVNIDKDAYLPEVQQQLALLAGQAPLAGPASAASPALPSPAATPARAVDLPFIVITLAVIALIGGPLVFVPLAMVPLVDEACGGCYRKLTPQVVNQVLLKSDLVMCENCNRILYSDEHQSTV